MTASSASSRFAEALATIAGALEAPRDRLGRLDHAALPDGGFAARERLRRLAVHYNTPGAVDIVEQCAQVARAALRR